MYLYVRLVVRFLCCFFYLTWYVCVTGYVSVTVITKNKDNIYHLKHAKCLLLVKLQNVLSYSRLKLAIKFENEFLTQKKEQWR